MANFESFISGIDRRFGKRAADTVLRGARGGMGGFNRVAGMATSRTSPMYGPHISEAFRPKYGPPHPGFRAETKIGDAIGNAVNASLGRPVGPTRKISKMRVARNTAIATGLAGGGFYAGRRSTVRNGLTSQNRGIYGY